jgi:DNA-binding NarL/FixJ family response regulator
MIHILLADDHPMVRAGVRAELEANADLRVVAEAGTADEAVQRASADNPAVAVLDVQLGVASGIHACRQIREAQPQCAVVMLTAFDWDVYLAQAWHAGAAAFVVKTADVDTLADVIRRVHTGQRVFSPAQHARIATWQREVAAPLATLTARERAVLRLVVAGKSNRAIAEALVISQSTVEKHISALLRKLGLRSARELLAFVIAHRLQAWLVDE